MYFSVTDKRIRCLSRANSALLCVLLQRQLIRVMAMSLFVFVVPRSELHKLFRFNGQAVGKCKVESELYERAIVWSGAVEVWSRAVAAETVEHKCLMRDIRT